MSAVDAGSSSITKSGFRFRLRLVDGTVSLLPTSLCGSSTLRDLKKAVSESLKLSYKRINLRFVVPPPILLENNDLTLEKLKVTSGNLIVTILEKEEEDIDPDSKSDKIVSSSGTTEEKSDEKLLTTTTLSVFSLDTGSMVKKEIPRDNCMIFSPIFFLKYLYDFYDRIV